MKNIKNTTKIIAALGLVAMLGACKPDMTKYKGDYQGYSYEINVFKDEREFSLSKPYESLRGKISYGIHAEDWNNDGRFDTISFYGLPKGHPLEEYVNLQKLEQAYQEIMNVNNNH